MTGAVQKWFESPEATDSDSVSVGGVDVRLALQRREWTARVVEHMVPDSVVADAPERIPYRLLQHMTDARASEHSFDDVFGTDGAPTDLAPLRPLFLYQTKKGASEIPIAFHVLMAKTPGFPVTTKTYTERTFRLLCTKPDGALDGELVRRLLSRFVAPTAKMNVAERAVLESLEPNFEPSDWEPDVGTGGVKPFMADVSDLFRRDAESILAADLSPSEFFRTFTRTLALHAGLLQPRLAHRLNPSMAMLRDATIDPSSVDLHRLVSIERGDDAEYRFNGRYAIRVPSMLEARPVQRDSSVRLSYRELDRHLTDLHFSLILYNHVARLVRAWYQQRHDIDDDAPYHTPSAVVQRLRGNRELRSYLDESLAALARRFVCDQLSNREEVLEAVKERAACGYDALSLALEVYNRETAATHYNFRSRKSGIQATEALLRMRDDEAFGIMRTRRGVGIYMELGTDTIPLLLLLVLGQSEKIRLDRFWAGVESYGLAMAQEERDNLLMRLKAMGLYERYSDAGEANYVRSLLVGGRQ